MPPRSWRCRLLWYTAWLIWLPALGYGISQGNLILSFVIALPALLMSLNFSLTKLVCPQCSYVIRTIGTPVTHCMKCGAHLRNDEPLPNSPQPQSESPHDNADHGKMAN